MWSCKCALLCGCCRTLAPEDEEKRRISRRIDNQLKRDKKMARREIKLLLLGTGDRGKSTFLRSMKILSGYKFDGVELKYFRVHIHSNIATGMQELIEAREKLNIEWQNEESTVDAAKFKSMLEGYKKDPDEFCKLIPHVKKLWADQAIKMTQKIRSTFHVADTVEYYLDDLDKFLDQEYLPSEQDILHCRAPTETITDCLIPIEGVPFRFIDVGGQRAQRYKWFKCFEGMTCLIYMVSSSEYDQSMVEGCRINRLEESLEWFKRILTHSHFARVSVILFLNKIDLLEEKLEFLRENSIAPDVSFLRGEPNDPSAVPCASQHQPKLESDKPDTQLRSNRSQSLKPPVISILPETPIRSATALGLKLYEASFSSDSEPLPGTSHSLKSHDKPVSSEPEPGPSTVVSSKSQHQAVSPDSEPRPSSSQSLKPPGQSPLPDTPHRPSSTPIIKLHDKAVSPDSEPLSGSSHSLKPDDESVSSESEPDSSTSHSSKSQQLAVSPDSEPRPSSSQSLKPPAQSALPDTPHRPSSSPIIKLHDKAVSPDSEPLPGPQSSLKPHDKSISPDSEPLPGSSVSLTSHDESVSSESVPGPSTSHSSKSQNQAVTPDTQPRPITSQSLKPPGQSPLPDTPHRPRSTPIIKLHGKVISFDSEPLPGSSHSLKPDDKSVSSESEPGPSTSHSSKSEHQAVSPDSEPRASTSQSLQPYPKPLSPIINITNAPCREKTPPQNTDNLRRPFGAPPRSSPSYRYDCVCCPKRRFIRSSHPNEFRTYGHFQHNFHGDFFSVEQIQKHMISMFLAKNMNPERQIYYHCTTAVDVENVNKVFQDVTATILQENLTKHNLN